MWRMQLILKISVLDLNTLLNSSLNEGYFDALFNEQYYLLKKKYLI